MREIVVGIMLCIQSYWDLRCKEIPSIVSVVGGAIGICMWYGTDKTITEIIVALFPGIVACSFSWISKEAVGYGDGILLLVLGIYYNLEELVVIVAIAIGGVGIFGLVLFVIFRKNGRYEIPFVPFLLLGWGIQGLLVYGGI